MKKHLFIFFAVICSLDAFTQTVPAYVPANGLVGWYPFTGNANDESGNGNNGVLMNGVTLCPDRNNNLNNAYNFDGNNDYIQTPINSNYNNYSFSAWINPNIISQMYLFGNDDEASSGKSMYLTNSGGLSIYNCHPIPSSNCYVIQSAVTASNTIVSNIWTHVLASVNSGTVTYYVNGINVGQGNGVEIFGINWVIGAKGNLFTQLPFNGKLDDIGVWDRALTQGEITSLYNSCALSVSTQPINQTVNISNTAQFTTQSSDVNATYQWQTNLGVGFQNLNNVGQYSGTTTNTLTVTNTSLSNNNQVFRCIINSGSCADTTSVAVLNVCGSITTQPINQTVNISNTAQFTTQSSDVNATYQWQTNLGVGFQNLSNAGQYSGASTNTLTVTNTSLSNNNQTFRCLINSGSCTDTSSIAILTVNNNVGVSELLNNDSFTIYPNPATNQATIIADNILIGSVYKVYNYIGKSVIEGKINSENTVVNLENLSQGIYVISIDDNIKQTFKIIKH